MPDLEERLAAPPGAPTAGEPCITRLDETAECSDDNYCAVTDSAPSFGLRYCGTCAPRKLRGEPCEESGQCVRSLWCIEGVCIEPLGVGQPCTAAEQCRFGICEGGTCARSEYASEPIADVVGTSCDGVGSCGNQLAVSCVDGTCSARSDEGEPCGDVPCRLDQSCVEGRCRAVDCTVDDPCRFCEGPCIDGRCQPVVGGSPGIGRDQSDGLPCDFDHDCVSGYCDRDLSDACTDGLCVIPPCNQCGRCARAPTAEDCGAR